jgi:hypothetical protein
MVKFVINCLLNIQTQHKFKYAQYQQILFLKLLFNVKLIYSIQVLGPWLWGNRLFFLQWWGRGRGPVTPVGQMPHQSMVLKNALIRRLEPIERPAEEASRCMC